MLLERGGDPNCPRENGATPLYGVINCMRGREVAISAAACASQSEDIALDLMSALLDKGAEPNARLKKRFGYSG